MSGQTNFLIRSDLVANFRIDLSKVIASGNKDCIIASIKSAEIYMGSELVESFVVPYNSNFVLAPPDA